MEDSRKFLNHINSNYTTLKCKFKKYCGDNHLSFNDDIFQESILRCYEAIERKGFLQDSSPYGCESYLFMSLKMNIKRESQYARNMKRDCNINSDNIASLYEEWYN